MKVVSRKTGGFESMDIMPSSANEYLKAQALILVGEWYLAWRTNRGLVITKPNRGCFFPLAGYVAMAGEAMRQITGIEAGYSMRYVVTHTAIVFRDSKPVEIVTTLRRNKLTDSIDSDSHDFVISSYSGSVWTKNREGRVKANGNFITTTTSPETLPRHIPVSRWYEILSHVRLNYGPEFQGLTRVTSSTTDCLAAAKVLNSRTCQEEPFLFHPAATTDVFCTGCL
jgi:hypothetical protein